MISVVSFNNIARSKYLLFDLITFKWKTEIFFVTAATKGLLCIGQVPLLMHESVHTCLELSAAATVFMVKATIESVSPSAAFTVFTVAVDKE